MKDISKSSDSLFHPFYSSPLLTKFVKTPYNNFCEVQLKNEVLNLHHSGCRSVNFILCYTLNVLLEIKYVKVLQKLTFLLLLLLVGGLNDSSVLSYLEKMSAVFNL